MDTSKLIKAYIKIRDAKDEAARAHDAVIADLQSDMDLIEAELLELCKTTGQDGGKTAYGTFTRSVKTRYTTSNWGAMRQFIKEHDALDLLEQRLHQGNFKQFLQDNPDKLPEGVNVDSRYSITVRRASK